MPDINVITGNLTVSGVTTLSNTAYIPSGYVSPGFYPTVTDTNLVKADTRFWLLNNNTEVPNPSPGYPNANTTGIRIQLNFTDLNLGQLDRQIRTQSFGIFTGNGFNTNTYVLTPEGFRQNFTGSFYIPWSFAAGPQGTRPATRLMTINERLDHIETSGTFALLNNHRIGFGTFQPQEKVHISNGNLRIDNTGFLNTLVLQNNYIPASSDAPGVSGQIARDSNYFYFYDGQKWKRTALSEW